MTIKKIVGYFFLTIASILILVLIVQFSKFLKALMGVLKIFSGQLDNYQIGFNLGVFVTWVIYFGILIVLLIFGLKWTSNLNNNIDSNEL